MPVSKQILVQNHSYQNEFDLHENEPVGRRGFHMNGFAHVQTCFDTEAKGNSEMAYIVKIRYFF